MQANLTKKESLFRTMRITFVAKKLDMDGGGSNFSLDLMARSLSERGHDVSILTIDPTMNDLPPDPPFDVITPPNSRFGTRIGLLEQVYRALSERADETDLFHVFTPTFLPAAGLFRKRDGSTPVVGQLNTYTMFCANMDRMNGECHRNCNIRAKFAHQDASIAKRIAKIPFYTSRTYAEPQLSNALDGYFAVSPAAKRIYSEVGLPERRIAVVPDFYDPEFLTGFDQPQYGPKSSGLRVLYVGRVEPLKGLDNLIRALPRTEGVTAKIVGDGQSLPELRSLASELDVDSRVSFEGWMDHEELPLYYYNADVFIHPARLPEPFGRTLLESMQCGTPAIVSDIGGPPWVVGDAGMAFPVGDDARLAQRLNELQADSNALSGLHEGCLERIERFSPEDVIKTIDSKYNQLCECF
jgi:glycosyltransferase involved in cell wall biosynthesis